jgi:leader peptidase (prepilin peptidase)/N-methyltransferase
MTVYLFIFIFGAVIGSFLNVVILRHNTGESVVYSSSRCFSCNKKLKWRELIPIFSFLIQKGKCRHCQSKISWQYPIVEFITGLVFVLIFWKIYDYSLLITGYWFLIFSLFIIISVYDIRHQIIPNGPVYFLIILSFLNLLRNSNLEIRNSDLLSNFLAGVAFFAFFFLIWLVSKGKGMGLGDAKISLAVGWLMGLGSGLIALLFSFWLAAIFGVLLLIFASKNFTLKSRIPFGPFLALGALVVFLFGSNILQIYFNLFSGI